MDFAATAQFSPISQQFIITNTGDAQLNLGTISVPAGFSISTFPDTTLASHASTMVEIQLDASSAGTFTGEVTVETNDSDEASFVFTVGGVVRSQHAEIAMYDWTTEVLSGVSTVDYGLTLVNSPVERAFIIINRGSTDLLLDTESLALPTGFAVGELFATNVPPGGWTSLVILLHAEEAGEYAGELSFETNDSDEGVFAFDLSAEVGLRAPSLVVEDHATASVLENTESTVAFGSTLEGTPVSRLFSISNTGTADLVIDLNTFSVPVGYSIVEWPDPTVAPGHSTSLRIQLDADTSDTYQGSVSFDTDDAGNTTFLFDITGEVLAAAPTIEVENLSPFGSLTDGTGEVLFGTTVSGVPRTREIRIRNVGTADLIIDLDSLIAPTGFEISIPPAETISPGASTTFTLTLLATSTGIFSDAVSVVSNDQGNSSVDFSISGTVVAAAPEIAVTLSGNPLQSGSDTVNFGSAVSGTSISRQFVISNTGTATLTLTSPLVSLPSGFSVESLFSTTVGAGSSTTLTVRLDATTPASYGGTLSFSNNDSDEGLFSIQLTGTVVPGAPVLRVQQNSTPPQQLVDGASTISFGRTPVGTPTTRSLTLHNDGTAALSLNSLQLPSGYSLVGSFPTSINAGAYATVTLRLDATTVGTPSGRVSFTRSDAPTNPFDFGISGEAFAPAEIAVRDLAAGNAAIAALAEIEDGVSSVTLVTTEGVPIQRSFRISNIGGDVLTLNQSSLTLPAGFSVETLFASTVAPGGFTTLTIQFDGETPSSGQISFTNSDANESTFNFTIRGEVTPDPTYYVVPGLGDAAEEITIKRTGNVNTIVVKVDGHETQYVTPEIGTFSVISIAAAGGADKLIIDLSGGDPLPGGYIKYDGGTVTTNTLEVKGGSRTESTEIYLVNGSKININVTDSVLRFADKATNITTGAFTLTNGTIRLPDGGKSLTIASLDVRSADNVIDVGRGSRLTVQGQTLTFMQGAARLVKAGAGTLVFAGFQYHMAGSEFVANEGVTQFNTDAGSSAAELNVLAVHSGTLMQFNYSQHLKSLTVSSGAKVRLIDGSQGTPSTSSELGRRLWIEGLNIDLATTYATPSQLDIGSGVLIVKYSNQPDPSASIQQMLRAGHAIATLNGPGIVSGTVRSERARDNSAAFSGLGWIDNSSFGYGYIAPNNRLTTTNTGNIYLASSSVVVSYALLGDANLDGVVDSTDQSRLTNGIATQGSPGALVNSWSNGDFNYDGVIDSTNDQSLLTQGGTYQTTNFQAPIFASPVMVNGQQGKTIYFSATAFDPTLRPTGLSPSSIVYSLISPPANVTIDAVTGDVKWTSVPAGSHTLTVRATNTHSVSISTTQTYTVNVSAAVNLTIASGGFTTSDDSLGLLKVTYSLAADVNAPFDIGVFASFPGASGTTDVRVMTYRVSDPNQRRSGANTVTFRADWLDWDKDYTLFAKIDASEELPESNNDDNSAPFTGGVFVAADGTVHIHGRNSSQSNLADLILIDSASELGAPTIHINGITIDVAPDLPLRELRVRLHDGSDTFEDQMDRLNWPFPERIYGGAGDDSITVRSSVALVDGGAGADFVVVSTIISGDAARSDYVDIGPEGIQLGGSGRISLRGVEGLEVDTGNGEDRIRVRAKPQGLSYFKIYAGTSSSEFDVNDVLDLSGFLNANSVPSLDYASIFGIDNVDLSHNNLPSLSSSYFDFLYDKPALKALDLRYNSLDLSIGTTLTSVGTNLTGLTQLSLHGNPNSDVNTNLSALAGKWLRVDLAPVELSKAENIRDQDEALAAIAKSLHYLPLAIFEYVLNDYEYEPYRGRMKDPLAVIQTHAGNDVDLANLLKALLAPYAGITDNSNSIRFAHNKATGTPAYYAYLEAGALRDWLGTTKSSTASQETAIAMLDRNGVHAEGVSTGGVLTAALMDMTWLEVKVGSEWKPLNPAYKSKDWSSIVSGYLDLLNLRLGTSYANFGELLAEQVPPNVESPSNLTTLDPGNSLVDSYFALKTVSGSKQDLTAQKQIVHTEPIQEWYEDRVSKWLAVNAPGLSLADIRYDGIIAPRHIATIEDAWPVQIKFKTAGATPGTYTELATSATEVYSILQTDYHRIVVSAKTVTTASGDVNDWSDPVVLNVADVGLSRIYVAQESQGVPQLYVDGVAHATIPSQPWALSLTVPTDGYFKIEIKYFKAGNTSTTADVVDVHKRLNKTVLAIAMDGSQVTASHLFDETRVVNEIETEAVAEARGASNGATITSFSAHDVGAYLSLVGSDYLQTQRTSQNVLNQIFRTARVTNAVPVAVASALSTVTTSNIQPNAQFPVVLTGLLIDPPQQAPESISYDPYTISVSSVPTSNKASNASKLLNAYQSSLLTLDSVAWSNWKVAHPTSGSTAVRNAIDSIFTTTVAGAGSIKWIALPQDLAASTGVAVTAKYEQKTALYVISSTGTKTTRGVVDDPLTVPFGDTTPPPPTSATAPVNIITGAAILEVVDISLPTPGLPLTFTRYYDSNSASQPDSPGNGLGGLKDLGQGWWHNYSDRLYATGTTNQPSGNNAVDWIDSQGRKFTIGTTGGSNPLYVLPSAMNGEFWYANGKYFYRDASGTGQRFSSNGTLEAILDQYGNELRLGYQNGKLSTIESVPVDSGCTPQDSGCPYQASTTVAAKLQIIYSSSGHISSIAEVVRDASGAETNARTWTYTVSQPSGAGSRYFLTQVTLPPTQLSLGATETTLSTQYSYYLGAEPALSPRHGKLKSIEGPEQSEVTYDYYANGRAFQLTDSDGFSQSFAFDLYGKRTTAFDTRGNPTAYTYSAAGNLIQIQFADRAKRTQVWDELSPRLRLTSETDEGNLTRKYSYAIPGTSPSQDDPYGKAWVVGTWLTTSYDTQGRPVFGEFLSSRTFAYSSAVDAGGHLILRRLTNERMVDSAGGTMEQTVYVYDDTNQRPQSLKKVIESNLRATYYVRANSGLVTDVITRSWQVAAGSSSSGADDPTLQLMSHQSFLYNNAGQVTQTTTDVLQTSATTAIQTVEHATYDQHGFLTSSIDGLNTAITYVHNSLGWGLDTVSPPAATETPTQLHSILSFNGLGAVVAASAVENDNVLRSSSSQYDARQSLRRSVKADGTVVSTQFDAAGNAAYQTDEAGRVTRLIYDERNRLVSAVRPDGTSSFSVYDGRGNVINSVDRVNRAGLILADGAIASDGLVRRTMTSYYDVRGLLIKQISPDPNGDPARASAAVVGYQYDDAGRVIAEIDARTTFHAWQNAAHRYDVNNDGTAWGGDALTGINALNSNQFGALGILPLSPTNARLFVDIDGDGHITGSDTLILINAINSAINSAAIPKIISGTIYQYDALGRVVKRIAPNATDAGIDSTLAAEPNVWQYKYDQPTDMSYSLPGGTNVMVGRRDTATDPLGRTQRMDYDERGRLVTQSVVKPAPDSQLLLLSKATFTYDDADNRRTVVDPRGYSENNVAKFTTTYEYDSRHQITSISTPASADGDPARLTTHLYDQFGNVVLSTLGVPTSLAPVVATTKTSYDKRNRVTETSGVIDSSGAMQTASTLYDDVGNPVVAVDPLGRKSRVVYDTMNRPVAAFDALGNHSSQEYTGDGLTLSATDAKGNTSQFRYDLLGRIRQEIAPDPDGTGSGENGQPLSHFYWYNRAGDLVVEAVSSSLWVPSEGQDPVLTPSYAVTQYSYDRLGRLKQQIDPDPDLVLSTPSLLSLPNITSGGAIHVYRYDVMGNLRMEVDPRGVAANGTWDSRYVTDYRYDDLDHLKEVEEPAPSLAGGERPLWKYQFDVDGNLTETIDPVGRKTRTKYDAVGLTTQTESFDSSGVRKSTVLSVYDDQNNLKKTTSNLIDPTSSGGIVTNYSYDLLGRQVGVELPAIAGTPRVSSVEYDVVGNVISSTDQLNRVTRYDYDPLGRLIATTAPSLAGQPSTATTIYDANSNVIRSVDALGLVTKHSYDNVNRQVTSTDPKGQTTTMAYDTVGNLVSVVDPRNVTMVYHYDLLGRLTEEGIKTGAGNDYDDDFSWRKSTYDVNGNLTQLVDRNNRATSYSYDLLNRLTSETWFANPTSTTALNAIISDYDLAGQLKWIYDSASYLEYTYDYAGHIASESNINSATNATLGGAPGVKLVYAYRADGQRSTLTENRLVGSSVGQTFKQTYVYETDATSGAETGRLRYLRNSTTGLNMVEFQYNTADQVTSIIRKNSSSSPGPTTAYQYELATGRLSSIKHSQAVFTSNSSTAWSKTVDAFSYAYDRGDRLTSWDTLLDGQTSYAYDKNGQLTSADRTTTAGDESYNYDDSGNRSSSGSNSGYAYDNQNRLVFDGTYAYTYDAEGNLTGKFVDADVSHSITSGDSDISVYTWDQRNRLSRFEHRSSFAATVDKRVDFTYDALDRRIQKTLDPDGATGTAAFVTSKYVYDGGNVYLQFDGSNNQTHRYINGLGLDEVYLDMGSGGSSWLLTDHQNSVRDVVDSARNTIVHKDYDSFGKVLDSEIASGAADVIFGYTGLQLDSETGLQYNRARYYDSSTGRFISADPIGIASGDTNLYRYVHNSPMLNMDPTGLSDGSLGPAPWTPGIYTDFPPGEGYVYSSKGVLSYYLGAGSTLLPDAIGGGVPPIGSVPNVSSDFFFPGIGNTPISFGAPNSSGSDDLAFLAQGGAGGPNANGGVTFWNPNTKSYYTVYPKPKPTPTVNNSGPPPFTIDALFSSRSRSNQPSGPSGPGPSDPGPSGPGPGPVTPPVLPGGIGSPTTLPSAFVTPGPSAWATAWTPLKYDAWFNSLPTRTASGNTAAMNFQRTYAGPTEYQVQGLGNRPVWADNIKGTGVIDAKMVENPRSSPQLGRAKPFFAQIYHTRISNEFGAYKSAILDPKTPLTSVEVRVDSKASVQFWENFLKSQSIPGRVVVAGDNMPPPINNRLPVQGFFRSQARPLGNAAVLTALTSFGDAFNTAVEKAAWRHVTDSASNPRSALANVAYLRGRFNDRHASNHMANFWAMISGSIDKRASEMERGNSAFDQLERYWQDRLLPAVPPPGYSPFPGN